MWFEDAKSHQNFTCSALQFNCIGLILIPCWKAGDTQALAPATEEQARDAAAPDTGAAGEDADEAMPDAGVASDEEDILAQPDGPDEQPHEVGTCPNARQILTLQIAVTIFHIHSLLGSRWKRHSEGTA